jgi:eukaryotic-like serine/threonine-protein kinase
MLLSAGARLGPYEITSPVSAGGMGEVYKATDTRLDRIVAIKILPPTPPADQQFRERFDREARLISQLDHPHICALYDVGEQDGTAFLVMQYLEGETLADRLKKGALPLDEALKVAIQIADALNAAHRAGVVHRDLKPGNIMLTKAGAKLLDFGLAKTTPAIDTGDESSAATIPHALTAYGVIVGTVHYMAPEQLDARPVDARADIFAFGTVLYEMINGRKAFDGQSPASVIGAIMSGTPPSMSAVHAPPALERVVTTCLAKDPDDRWQTARDLGRELQWIAAGASDIASGAPRPFAPRRRWTRAAPWAAAAALATGIAAVLMMTPRARDVSPTRVLVDLGSDGSMPLEVGPNVTLSPDGSALAFIALERGSNTTHLYQRRLDQLRATPLAGTDNARNPFFSPDGQSIAYFDEENRKLKKVSITGGAPVTLCDAPDARGGVWTDDGTIVFQPTPTSGKSLMRVSAAGGAAEPFVSAAEISGSIRWPQILSGGKAVLYTAGVATEFETGVIAVQALPHGTPKIILRNAYYGRYVSTGHILYLHEGTLFAVPFDADRAEATGPAVQVIENVSGSVGTGGAQFVVSRTGTLMYVPSEPDQDVISWMDRSGRATVLRAAAGIWTDLAFSPDGTRLAIEISNGKQFDTWVYEWARDIATKLTLDRSGAVRPVWAPDGRRLAFASRRAGPLNLFWMPADGSAEPQRLTESAYAQAPDSWHPSGRYVAYTETRPDTRDDLMVLPITGGEASCWKPGIPTVFLSTPFSEAHAMFSPDGRWIAYDSDETGRREVFVRPFPGPGAKVQISVDGGNAPRWSPAKRELLYRGADNRIMAAAYSAAGDSFRAEKSRLWSPRALPPGIMRPMQRTVFAVHPDGERIALFVPPDAAPGAQNKVVLVFNFFELRRLVRPMAH